MLSREESLCDYDARALVVRPHRLIRGHHAHYLDFAERMLNIYRQGVGRRRRDLHRDVEAVFDQEECHPRCIKAFQKLLDDESRFESVRRDAYDLRRRVSEQAALRYPLERVY